jgi:transposase-like protein
MISSSSLKTTSRPDVPARNIADAARELGIILAKKPCPKCGSRMFVKRAPCFIAKLGYRRAVRCVRCGYQEGAGKRK